MTPQELYDWAVDNGCENYDLAVRVFKDGRERVFSIEIEYQEIDDPHDKIIFDV